MKILLADDHQLIRDGLKIMLSGLFAQSPIFLEACTFEQAGHQLTQHADVSLAIVDMRMADAIDSTPLLRLACAFAKIPLVVLSGFLESECVHALLGQPSVHAVVSKNGGPDTLRYVVLEALAGRKLGDANHVLQEKTVVVPESQLKTFSPRLQKIYTMLCEGKSNKSIAWEINLTEGTVKNYVSTIYRQLNVHNRIQAVRGAPNEQERSS